MRLEQYMVGFHNYFICPCIMILGYALRRMSFTIMECNDNMVSFYAAHLILQECHLLTIPLFKTFVLSTWFFLPQDFCCNKLLRV